MTEKSQLHQSKVELDKRRVEVIKLINYKYKNPELEFSQLEEIVKRLEEIASEKKL